MFLSCTVLRKLEMTQYVLNLVFVNLFIEIVMDYKKTLRFPKNQIGFIINPASALETTTFYGMNYFNFSFIDTDSLCPW